VEFDALVAGSDEDVRQVLRKYRHVFPDSLPLQMPEPRGIKAHLRLIPGKTLPRKIVRRSCGVEENAAIEAEASMLLAHGLVRQVVHVPFAAPAFRVAKPGSDKMRTVYDYRLVNEAIESPPMVVPEARECLEALRGATVFGSLDLRSAFWQIPLASGRELTAFVTPGGRIFEWNVVPFGNNCAPAICQATTTAALGDLLFRNAVVYIDDIVVWGRTRQEFLDALEEVLQRLSAHRLFVSPAKCKLAVEQLRFLGHVVDKDGIMVDPSKVADVRSVPVPKSVTELRRFLGMLNYHSEALPGLRVMVRALDAATGGKKPNKKGGPVVLSAEQVGAFEDAKDLLCDAVKRARFEPTWQTLLVTDASDVGCGAALYQRPPDAGSGAWRPIAFWSKAFSSGAAVRWPVWEKELFALFSAGKLWRGFIAQGKQRTIVWTDSRVVSHFRSAQWGGGAESSKVLGWAMLLSTLRIDVSHIRGDTNIAADFLSREVAALGKEGLLGERPLRLDNPVLEDLELDEPLSLRVIRTADNEGGLCLIPFDTRASEADVRVWEAAYLACPDYGTDFRRLQAESGGGGTAAAGPTQLYRGVLQKGSVVLVPLALRLRVVQEMHKRLGHPGETRLVMALRERFEFPKLRSEARCIVSTCGTCCLLKGHRRLRRVLNAPIPPPVSRWADVCMDFMFLGPVRDHRGGVWDKVLLVVDMCSRYVIAMPAKRNDTAPSMWKDVRTGYFLCLGCRRQSSQTRTLCLFPVGPSSRPQSWVYGGGLQPPHTPRQTGCQRGRCRLSSSV